MSRQDRSYEKLSSFFKVLGDRTRLGILGLLSQKEMCVHDITQLLEMEQSAVSHQLRTLKDARLVKTKREGRKIFYMLDDEHVHQIFNIASEHMTEEKRR